MAVKIAENNLRVMYHNNDGTYVDFHNVSQRQRDVLVSYQILFKKLYKMIDEENKLKKKDGKSTKRPNNTKSTTKTRAKKPSRNKKVRGSSREL